MQNKRRRNKSSKFIPNLHKILNDKDSGAFWRQDGKTFVLSDMSQIISNSLPKYFRHSNISSFIRQLNLYGFKKLTGEQLPQNTYFHEKFKKNVIIQLKPIRSFYNQQKYGSGKKNKRCQVDEEEQQIIEQNSQPSQIVKVTGISDQISSMNYKEKIEMLEKQNARLRIIEQQHKQLLNFLNSKPQRNKIQTKHLKSQRQVNPYEYSNIYSNYQQYNNFHNGQHSYPFLNKRQNIGLNWPITQSAYYYPYFGLQ